MTVCTAPPGSCGRPFTTRDAAAAGVSPMTLRSARVRRLFRGTYVCVCREPDLRTRVRSALLVAPTDAVVSHATALSLHGVDVGPTSTVHLSSTHRHQVDRPGLVVHRRRVLPPSTRRVALPSAAWADTCSQVDLVEGVVLADQLLAAGLADPDQLGAAANGRPRARAAVVLAAPRTRSPQETRSRLLVVLAGLPEPEVNVDVLDEDGVWLGCVDLAWLHHRTVAEYDGRQHAESTYQWNRDLDRVEGFTRRAWCFERITRQRLRTPRQVVRRIELGLRAGGYTGPAATFDARWSALFDRRWS